MEFKCKTNKHIFKGEGIYHLTFVVSGRRPLLGQLVPIEQSKAYSRLQDKYYQQALRHALPTRLTNQLATTELSELGYIVLNHLMELETNFEDFHHLPQHKQDKKLQIYGKQIMPDHLHVVMRVNENMGLSIRQVAHIFHIGVRKTAEEKGFWKHEDGPLLEAPYIRTLVQKGQLRRMIDYVHANPDNAWMRKMHPDLYTIRRSRTIAGLQFDTMGKERLLDYPDVSIIALPRTLTAEQITDEVQQALHNAQRGCITYTAAINKGERTVAIAIREAGFPLVVMMQKGFPPEGSEAARFFHPGMVYHQACGEGRLFLLAPHPDNYLNPELIARTDDTLRRKDEAKGLHYQPIPHSSTRWRMIAGNEMLRMIAEDRGQRIEQKS